MPFFACQEIVGHIRGARCILYTGDSMNIRFILMIGFFALAGAACILAVMVKSGFVKSLLFSAVSGIGLLLGIHFTSLMSSLSVPVNAVSLVSSALGGIPAVAAMVVMRFF